MLARASNAARRTMSRTVGWQSTCACIVHRITTSMVLDPFSGSGTTGIAALGLGRSFIGIELNKDYADLSGERIREAAPLLNHVRLIEGGAE